MHSRRQLLPYKKFAVFFSLLALLTAFSGNIQSQGKSQAASPQPLPAMLARANALTDLGTATPYELHAQIVVEPGAKHEQQGTITMYRDHGRARTEIQLGDFHQTEVVREDTRYVSRSWPYPLAGLDVLDDVQSALHFIELFPARTKFGKAYQRMIGGTTASCYDAHLAYLGKMRFCFDPASGAVLDASDYAGWKGRFSGYRAAGSRMFPSTMELVQPLKPRHVEISKIQITQRQFADSDFAAPAEAHAFAVCASPSKATPDLGTRWVQARQHDPEAYLYAIVEADGTAHDIAVYGASHKWIEREVRKLATEGSFTAAHCGATAVSSELVLPLAQYQPGSNSYSGESGSSPSTSNYYPDTNYWNLANSGRWGK